MADIAVLGLRVDASGAVVATENLGRKLNALGQQADKTTDSLGKTVAKLAAIGVTTAGLVAAVREAQNFEKQMALVSTVTDSATTSTMVFGKQVLALFRALPVQSVDELTKGLYDIISAGVPAGDAMKYLDTAARAAIAGVTSTAVAVDALTTVTNAWRQQNVTAAEASDQLFNAVNIGKITFEELASSIGIIAPIAAAYKISLDDVLAATAQLTINGQTASVALTGIRSAIANIINPTNEFAQQFPKLAKEFNAAKLETDGFSKFLLDLQKATGGSKEAINALFTDIQGKTSVFALLADGGQQLTEFLDKMGKSSGAAGGAFDKLENTSAALNQRLTNDLKATLIEISQGALPAVNAVLKISNDVFAWLRDNLPIVAGVLAAVTAGFIAYAAASRAAATYTALLTAAQGIQAFISLARTVRSAADAMTLLSIVGKGAAGAVAAIAAIVAGYAAYKIAVNAIEEDQKKFNEELDRTSKALAAQGQNTPAVPGTTPTGSPKSLGPTPEEAKRSKEIADAAAERVLLAQQELDLVTKIGLAAELQVIANKADVETMRARNSLKGEELRVTLEAIGKEKELAAATATSRRALSLDEENKERVQAARDALLLVGLEGKALRDAQIELKKQNDLARARVELQGFELQQREEAIHKEAALSLESS